MPAEAELLAALAARLFDEAFGRHNAPEDIARYLAAHFTPEALGALLAHSEGTVLLLERAGTPMGWAHLLGEPASEALEIRRFYVDGAAHGTGAAMVLMSAALAEARARGASRVWLAVWEHNHRARAFYAKHGFVQVGTQPFQLGADVQTDVVLSRPRSFGLTLAVIAGGQARRLGGAAKALIEVQGRPILQRLLDLRTLADEVLLVSSDARLAVAGVERVADVLLDRGAPGGVHAALLHAAQPWVLAVAGDMPFLDGRVVAPLLAARADGVEAVAYERDGRLEPFAALYRTSLGPRWTTLLEARNLPFRALWDELSGRRLDARALDALGLAPGVLRSLNTEEDRARWADPPSGRLR